MKEFTVIFIGVILLSIMLGIPICWLEGSAKSQYLKEQKGMEIVWYKAAFLPDNVFIDAKINRE